MRLPFSSVFKIKGETSSPHYDEGLSGFFLMPHVLVEICAVALSWDIFKAMPESGYISPEQELYS